MIRDTINSIFANQYIADQRTLMFTVGKSELYAFFDAENHQVQYDVLLQPDSYLAIGYGASFENTDVVYWAANGTHGVQQDMFAYSPLAIEADARNAYSTTYQVLADNSVHFTTVRDLDTFNENFVIPLDELITMVCAYSDTTHSISQD